jgi:hypothetical protein
MITLVLFAVIIVINILALVYLIKHGADHRDHHPWRPPWMH